MLDIWSWISDLPNSDSWSESNSPPQVLELATYYKPGDDESTRAIQLTADRTSGSNSEALVTFSLTLKGFQPFTASKTLWVSDTCRLTSDKPFLPLVLQLLQEIITRSPMAHNSTCPRSRLHRVRPEPVSWIMDSHSPESFSGFFDLVFVTRLFWLCVLDAPSEVGSLFFESLLGPHIEVLSGSHAPVLRTFLVTVGVDAELCLMRTIGYMLAKWFILRELAVGLKTIWAFPGQKLGFSYALEAHGLWVLKGYAQIMSMKVVCSKDKKFPAMEANESALKYALAHQQLEAVIQLEYSVGFRDGYILVKARVDNLRFQVARLGFNEDDHAGFSNERHFVSRARVWVGPEVGTTYVVGLSLGRSTENAQREVELQRSMKGDFERTKVDEVKTSARIGTRTRMKNWRWDQDVDGNAVIFEAVLYDNVSGHEVATWKPSGGESENRLGSRYKGPNRPYTKMGGLVFAGDEYGDGVGWRVNKEMEGSVLKWRIGGQVWVSYWPNEVKSSYYETRCVEWCDEVDLPLIHPGKLIN